ncbi:hypothetical protein PENTCL1PPCAC_25270, partial [Pristionchus entomophagus]
FILHTLSIFCPARAHGNLRESFFPSSLTIPTLASGYLSANRGYGGVSRRWKGRLVDGRGQVEDIANELREVEDLKHTLNHDLSHVSLLLLVARRLSVLNGEIGSEDVRGKIAHQI